MGAPVAAGSNGPGRPARGRRIRDRLASLPATRRRELVLGLVLVLLYGFFHQTPRSNENTRYDLVMAMVEHHTTRIDGYEGNTVDRARYGGHYYSDKEPGMSLLGVPVYLLTHATARALGRRPPGRDQDVQTLAFVLAGLPTVLLSLLLLRLLRTMVEEWWALIITLGLAAGTMAFCFATVYFGHAAAACLLFATFCAVRRAPPGERSALLLVAGLLAGTAVLVDLATAPGLAIVGAYALAREPRGLLRMGVGAMPPLLALLAYNWISFGSPLHLGYANLDDPRFASGMGHGLLGVGVPSPAALQQIVLGPRGLLILSPWLGLAPAALWPGRRSEHRRELVVCAAVCVTYLLLNAGYFLPFGGDTPGPRFLMPALPFAAVLVALAPRAVRPLTIALLLASIVVVFLATAAGPTITVDRPLQDFWLPLTSSGFMVETTPWLRLGWHGLEPLLALAGAALLTMIALTTVARSRAASRRLNLGATGGLALLVLTLGTPLDPLTAIAEAAPPNLPSQSALAVVDSGVGVVRLHVDGPPAAVVWAQIENRGAPVSGTRVVLSLHAVDGSSAIQSVFDGVGWTGRSRLSLDAVWAVARLGAGHYRVVATVISPTGRVLAARDPAGTVTVEPRGVMAG